MRRKKTILGEPRIEPTIAELELQRQQQCEHDNKKYDIDYSGILKEQLEELTVHITESVMLIHPDDPAYNDAYKIEKALLKFRKNFINKQGISHNDIFHFTNIVNYNTNFSGHPIMTNIYYIQDNLNKIMKEGNLDINTKVINILNN